MSIVKTVALKVLLIFLGIVVGLGVIEVYFRLFKPQKSFSKLEMSYAYNCYQKGDYYWLALKPNQNCLFHSNAAAFEDFKVKTNSLGLRSPEVVNPKPQGTYRILFLGDSYTFGLGVKENEAFPRLIENYLNDNLPGKKKEVINAGLPGVGPGYYYLFLKNNLTLIKPDMVVVAFFMQNDVIDSFFSNWEDEDEKGLPTEITSTSSAVDSISGFVLPKKIALKYKVPTLRRLHTFIFLMDTFYPENVFSLSFMVSNPVITPETCLYKRDCHDLDAAKAKIEKLFLGIKEQVDHASAKLLVVSIPPEFQISSRGVRFRYGIYIPLFQSDKDYPYEFFGNYFKEQKVEFLDLRPDLKEKEAEKPLYFSLDNHFNEDGHQATAEIIGPKILELVKSN